MKNLFLKTYKLSERSIFWLLFLMEKTKMLEKNENFHEILLNKAGLCPTVFVLEQVQFVVFENFLLCFLWGTFYQDTIQSRNATYRAFLSSWWFVFLLEASHGLLVFWNIRQDPLNVQARLNCWLTLAIIHGVGHLRVLFFMVWANYVWYVGKHIFLFKLTHCCRAVSK